MKKLIQGFFISLVSCFFVTKTIGQNTSYISGYIKGIGSGKKIFLGNKPNGIGLGFSYIIYDSTYTRNDSFYFNPIHFKYVSDFSIQQGDSEQWIPFLIDTGQIFVSGNIDTFYRSRVSGSGNHEVLKKFYRELYNPWDKAFFSIRNNLQQRKEIDSNLYLRSLDTIDNLTNRYRQEIIKFYEQNVNYKPYAAFRALRMATLEMMPDSLLRKYFNLLPTEVQNSIPLEDINYRLNGFRENVRTGKKIPDFTFFTPAMKTVNLYDIKSDYKLVVFWASWCAPCLAEIPALDSLYQRYKQKNLKILTVNVDNTSILWKKNISKYTFESEHLYQGGYSSSAIYKYFNIKSIPFLVLLDKSDRIIKYNISIEEISEFIK